MTTRFFEDFAPGQVYELGSHEMTRDAIVAFARQFDPQPFHVDAEAAARSPYGGLIASGWHTAALVMRLYSERYLSRVAILVSPGVDELRWLLPVRPGDRLRIRVTVREARPSRSKPDRGVVKVHTRVFKQDNTLVAEFKRAVLVPRKDPGA